MGRQAARITAAEYRKQPKGNKRVKNATPTVRDGIKFHSKREADRYTYLKHRESLGEITNLELQIKIPLHGKDRPILTPTGNQRHAVIDFRYVDWDLGGVWVYDDAKGHQTEVSELKYAILAAQGIMVTLS